MSCNKPAKTYAEQLQILKNRGLLAELSQISRLLEFFRFEN